MKIKNILYNVGKFVTTLAMPFIIYGCGNSKIKNDASIKQIEKKNKLELTADSTKIDSILNKKINYFWSKGDSLLPYSERRTKKAELSRQYQEMIHAEVERRVLKKGYEKEKGIDSAHIRQLFYTDVKKDFEDLYGGRKAYINERLKEWEKENSKDIFWQIRCERDLNAARKEHSYFTNFFSENPEEFREKYLK